MTDPRTRAGSDLRTDPQVQATLDLVAGWAPVLSVRTSPELLGDVHDERYLVAELLATGSDLPRLLVDRHARARRLPYGRHAASLVYQRYSHRICSLTVAAYAADELCLDLGPEQVEMVFDGGSPSVTVLRAPVRTLDGADLDALIDDVVDRHLLPLARALHSCAGVGMPNLWGNMAAGFATGCRTVARHLGVETGLRLGEAVAACHPRLARGGAYRVLSAGAREGLFYDRASCCHWYAVPDGRLCTWCSRVPREQRTATFLASLTD